MDVRRVFAGAVVGVVVSGATAGDLPPTGTAALLRWLRAGEYRMRFTPEPSVRTSSSAHGLHVRSWYSPTLVAALRAGTVPFGRGAAMVKELYFEGTDGVVGWSVMRKVRRRSANGRGWFFFETFDGKRAIARGRRVGVCVGCHADGTDFLLSAFRP